MGDKIIRDSVRWTLAGSPYSSGSVQIASGASLTIEAGVKVENVSIYSVGSISLEGTSSAPVVVNSESGGIMLGSGGSAEVDHAVFNAPSAVVAGDNFNTSVTFTNSRHNKVGSARGVTNQFPRAATIERNVFVGVSGMFLQAGQKWRYNRFRGSVDPDADPYEYLLTAKASDPAPIVEANVFEASARPRIFTLQSSTDYDLRGNFWETDDPNEIAASIIDGGDYVDLGRVMFEPFLRALPEDAPSIEPHSVSGLSASAQDRSVSLAWSPPPSDGGNRVTSYTVRSDASGKIQTLPSSVRTVNLGGLENSRTYEFSVTATNARGQSAPATVLATPVGPPLPPLVSAPEAPVLRAKRMDRQIALSWQSPELNGSAVTEYRIAGSNGRTYRLPPTATSLNVSGLINGRSYSFSIVALSNAGNSTASVAARATPAGKPVRPSRPKVSAGKRKVGISWVARSSNGAPFTSFTIRRSDGKKRVVSRTARSYKWTGLKKGKKYSFTVYARNSVGTSIASYASVRVKVK